MNVDYIARQPVLDHNLNTWGYELLFRAGIKNSFVNSEDGVDGDTATMSVINNALLGNISSHTKDEKSLINFTRSLIVDDYALLLNKENVIIEILEDVIPDKKVIDSCRKLKEKGYTLALDDFFFNKDYHELLKLADIVKLDFVAASADEIKEIVNRIKSYEVTILAEKVESQEDYNFARSLGCELFQGYFFGKPVMEKRESIKESKFSKLRLISEVNSSSFDIDSIENIIKSDPVLTLRLLKYLNSAYFSFRSEIKSIHQAIAMLGPKRIKRWTTVVTTADLSEGKPIELLKESFFRAKFCETIGQNIESNIFLDDFFLMGLLSYVDAFFGQPKEVLVGDLPLSNNIKHALLGYDQKSILSNSLELAQAMELGLWDYVDSISSEKKIDGNLIKTAYLDAINQATEYVSTIPL